MSYVLGYMTKTTEQFASKLVAIDLSYGLLIMGVD